MKHDLFLFVQFSFPQKLILDCFNFSKAALNFYKWYHYNEKIFDFFCILFFLKKYFNQRQSNQDVLFWGTQD